MKIKLRTRRLLSGVAAVAVAATGVTVWTTQQTETAHAAAGGDAVVVADRDTTTPIKHVVVLFQENRSFDHYFATYPHAANTDGTPFAATTDTPRDIETELRAGLLPGDQVTAHNPNGGKDHDDPLYTDPNPNAYQPERLSPEQAVTCSQNHNYGAEQLAVDGGRMGKFIEHTNTTCATNGTYSSPGLVMDYFDGNTVTGLWNYAQNYAMSDNNWDAVFGPSTPGHLNLISGNTYTGSTTITDDPDPNGDQFGSNAAKTTPHMFGANIGDLLNEKGVSWGWFQGGFASEEATTPNILGVHQQDYSPHHNPFQYYGSTANWDHTLPTDGGEVGHDGAANHQYDLAVFDAAVAGTDVNGVVPELPAVSYVKAPQARDGHPGYSDPLDEQVFLTEQINAIMASPYWPETAIVVTYDDSDGSYDHVAPVIRNSSTGFSGDAAICTTAAGNGVPALAGQAGRCGPSQRLPLLVISPYAKRNHVSHVYTTQASVLRFVEDNWSTGRIDDVSAVKGSFDASANGLDDFFDWSHPQAKTLELDSELDSPAFGAVTERPDPVSPATPAPVIGLAHHRLRLPAGTAAPSEEEFLSQVGATITSGTLAADLSDIDTDAVGTYRVDVTGATGDVPSMNPQRVDVQVAPVLTLAHPSLSFLVGTAPSPSVVRSLAGASIVGGEMDLPDLSGADFSKPGTYQVEITGSGNGVEAIPATLTIVVRSAAGRPVITAMRTSLAYPVGSAPTAEQVRATAGAAITRGRLDPIPLSGVDFAKPGSYAVQVTGSAEGRDAEPVTLNIVVIAPPTISLGRPTITVPVGTRLTAPLVLASSLASISSGSLESLDVSGVDTRKAGTYGLSITGSDRGVAASPVSLTVRVVAASASAKPPVASRTTLKAPHRVRAGRKAGVTVRVQIKVKAHGATPRGAVVLYDGGKVRRKATVAASGVVEVRVKLRPGKHRLAAAYVGNAHANPPVLGSTTKTVVVKVARRHR